MHNRLNDSPVSRWKTRYVTIPTTDLIVQASNALVCILALLAFAPNLKRSALYLLTHVALAAAIAVLAALDQARTPRSRWLGFAHDWLPAVILMSFFFELGLLIPRVHMFDHYRYDQILQAVDVWLVGDPDALIAELARPWLSDLLTLCYLAYFPLILVVPAVLYARGEIANFQRATAIIMCGFSLTYAGYLAFPAVGPHWLTQLPRPAALAGYGFAGYIHAILRAIPAEPPDAFPSGHALMGMLAPALAFRFRRPLFFWLLPIGTGTVLSTIYLRYHYLLDIVAAALLAPIAWKLARALQLANSDPRAERFDAPATACQPRNPRASF